MLVQDIEHLVVVLVERVLVARRLHPREDERAAARHHVHEPTRFLERFDGAAIHARMDCDEVDAVLSVAAHDVEEVLGGDGDESLLEVAYGIVHGNGADHRRRLLDQPRAERLRLPTVRQVHDRLGAKLEGNVDLLPFDLLIGKIARDTQVHVHLRAKPLAHALGGKRRVVDVRRDGNAAGCDPLADEFGRAALLFSDDAHSGRDFPCAREIDLRDFGMRNYLAVRHYPTPFVGIIHIRFRVEAKARFLSARRAA